MLIRLDGKLAHDDRKPYSPDIIEWYGLPLKNPLRHPKVQRWNVFR